MVKYFTIISLSVIAIALSRPEGVYPFTDKEIKDRIIPIIDATVYESYSSSDSGSDLWGVNAAGVFSPTIKLSDRSYAIPVYQGGYQRQYQIVTEDEGNRRYSETQYHNSSLSYFQRLTERLSAKLTGLARVQFNNETNDEKWGKGLYDYRDIGGGVDTGYRFPQGEKAVGEFSGGFEYYLRVYPNYKSLISLISATAPETDEKDYSGYQMIYGYKATAPRGSGEIKYSLLIKEYLDKKVIEELGTLDMDEKRRDYLQMWGANITVPFDRTLSLSLNSNVAYNISNQNYYDARGTTTNLSDDVFTYSYYDYYSFGGGPVVTFRFPIGEGKNDCSVSAGYDFTYRAYTNRKAQISTSAYTQDNQADIYHAIRTNFRYPLTKRVSLVASGDYTFARSNTSYDRYYRYNYDLLNVTCGINLKY